MPTFAARRSYRPKVMLAGLGILAICGVAAALLAVAGTPELAPYLVGAGVISYFLSTIGAIIPQQVTLAISGSTITPSWRTPIRLDAPPALGSWVVPGLDAPMGVVLHAGPLRIGGQDHDGDGYDLRAGPSRSVDCHVGKVELDAIAALLGVPRGRQGPLVVPLVRNRQTLRGVLGQIAPWFATIVVLGVFGGVVGSTELGRRVMSTPAGMMVATGISVAVVIAGIVVTMLRARRVRPPELELREERDALVVAAVDGSIVARVAWAALTVEKRRHVVSSRVGTFTMPALWLGLGTGKPLRIGAWDTRLAWGEQVARGSPHWIVGAAHWTRLVETLRRHHRI